MRPKGIWCADTPTNEYGSRRPCRGTPLTEEIRPGVTWLQQNLHTCASDHPFLRASMFVIHASRYQFVVSCFDTTVCHSKVIDFVHTPGLRVSRPCGSCEPCCTCPLSNFREKKWRPWFGEKRPRVKIARQCSQAGLLFVTLGDRTGPASYMTVTTGEKFFFALSQLDKGKTLARVALCQDEIKEKPRSKFFQWWSHNQKRCFTG